MRNISVAYEIEKDVPIPVQRHSTVPLSQMEVGDSIQFPVNRRSSIAASASKLKKASGKDFTIKKVDEDNCRVWRTK